MWIIVGFIVYMYVLYKPVYSASEHLFWSSMELAAVRDPIMHRIIVDGMAGSVRRDLLF